MHQARRPADADQQPIRTGDPNLIKAPFAMAKDTPRPDDQVVDPRCNFIHLGSADEDAEGIMILRHPPGPRTRLGEMNLASPTSHDDVGIVTAGPVKSQAFPERNRRLEIIAWNDGKRADASRYCQRPIPSNISPNFISEPSGPDQARRMAKRRRCCEPHFSWKHG